MAKRLQHRGGTTSQHSSFTGAVREVTVDTDKNTLVIHDGSTAGGHPLATATNFKSTGIDDNADAVAITIDSSENVGIGNTTMSSFSSAGTTRFVVGDGSGDEGMTIYSGNASSANIAFADGTSGDARHAGIISYLHGENSMRFFTNSTEKLKILSDGKVGIGTTSPTKQLGIGGTGDISLQGSSNAIAFYDSSSLKAYITSQSFGDHNGDGLGLVTSGNEPFKFFANGTERFRIDGSGGVLIGTTSLPTSDSKLTIQNSSSHCEVNIMSGTSHGSLINMGDTGDYNIGRIKYDNSSNSMQFQTNNSERMRIDSSGNVGIGTSSPNTTLTVLNSTAPTFDNDTHAGESIFIRSGGSGGSGNAQAVLAFGKADSSSLRSGSAIASVQTDSDIDKIGLGFYTSDGSASAQTLDQRMLLTHTGNLGVGETAPLGKLHVKTADSSSGAHANADELVIEGSAYSGMTIASGTTSHGTIAFADSGDELAGRIIYNHSTNALSFGTSGVGTQWSINSDGNLLPGNSTGQGIHLGVTSAGAANLLDDYEEGTWTPSGPSLGVATIHKAVYTKIGNVVTVYCDITYNSSPADTAQATSMSGLPFSASDDYYQQNTRVATRNQNISAQVGGTTVSFRDVADGVIMTRSEFAGKRAQHTFIYTTA